ncbi:hypothetical protein T069G_00001 [Trichoderma breve]|uniref:2EXR domain-containing protein n=1 Tax=Trichoderma breve TaxID=2034170 RepID=A0A9W9EB52_9HYPO|nr:hypothetical protein T069G_00001 [Trichoderma breve]KAJ4863471.1 hypothetical protein T069G_00001 [Trichoderma breve]
METQSTAFPQFTLLPVELRLAIWFYCLPHRVVQRDDPYDEVQRLRKEHKCWSVRPSLKNAAPPRIASVCRESRQVAMRWGKMVSQDYNWNLGPIWIQPRLDTYHLNLTSEAAEAIWEGGLEKAQVDEFIKDGLIWLDTIPLSIPSEYYFDFDLGLQDVCRMRRLPHIEIRDDFVDEDLNVVYNEYANYGPRPFTHISLSATMAFITIHAKRRHAVASGLFGLLLDAPVQLVDFDDERNIRSFHALFKRDIYNHKRTEVIKLFSLILSPIFRSRVQDWTEKVDWLMMVTAWLRAKMNWENCIPFDGDPFSAWNPIIEEFPDGQRLVYMGDGENYVNRFDDDNPWVIQAKKELPRVTPKILFMLCTDDCNVDGNVGMVPSVQRPNARRNDFFEVNCYENL